ncbi:rolling pebbles-like protein [Colletotrichum musicola]|uniref:Rolling pebbles-like protein n=1 Tax=Colletotrichum musicola TaxID=2175873 RepID=A0A8H6N6E0_9PEZI|nr:rolling pebbles-like protein [Colletotrichum musicola]
MAMAASDTGWGDMSPGSRSANTTAAVAATGAQRSPQRRTQSYAEAEWEERKETIKYLFLDQDMPLPDVVEALSIEYDFHTNERMCKTRLKRWGFKKNSSKHRPSRFRDKRPAKSQDTLDRTARRLEGKNKKAATQMSDRPAAIEEATQELPREVLSGDPASVPVATRSIPWAMDAELSGLNHVADQYISFHDIPYQSADHIDGKPSTSQRITSEANSGPYSQKDTEQAYEEACPYRHGQFKFRLMQDLGSGAMHQTDILSDGSRVDVFDEKLCSPGCACRRPGHFPSAFAFLARASGEDLEITIFSSRLNEELLSILPGEDRLELEKTTFSASFLLKYFYQIRHRLRDIDVECTGPLKDTLEALLELELLVDYLLGDCNIISTLGFEQLHAKGFLTYDLWQYFQDMKLQSNIDRLDETFLEIDECESPENETLLCSDASDCWCGAFPGMAQRSFQDYKKWMEKLVCDGNIDRLQSALQHSDGPWAPEPDDLYRYADWLRSAARRGHCGIVRLLLDHGADADGGTIGETPLFAAASGGHLDVVRLLLDRGAVVDASNMFRDALSAARRGQHLGVAASLPSVQWSNGGDEA